MTQTYKSGILEAVHEMATDLHIAGAIDTAKMQEFDVMCFTPAPTYTSEMVRSLRSKRNLTQVMLASLLNISLSTVQKWEVGAKKPGGPSNKLLYLLDKKGVEGLTVTA